jgi:hypothetical protein
VAVFNIQNYKVKRILSVFNNQTIELIAEHLLSHFELTKFKQHFGVSNDDNDSEMTMEYSVELKDVNILSKYLVEDISFDFDKYSYFLSCYRVDE